VSLPLSATWGSARWETNNSTGVNDYNSVIKFIEKIGVHVQHFVAAEQIL